MFFDCILYALTNFYNHLSIYAEVVLIKTSMISSSSGSENAPHTKINRLVLAIFLAQVTQARSGTFQEMERSRLQRLSENG